MVTWSSEMLTTIMARYLQVDVHWAAINEDEVETEVEEYNYDDDGYNDDDSNDDYDAHDDDGDDGDDDGDDDDDDGFFSSQW